MLRHSCMWALVAHDEIPAGVEHLLDILPEQEQPFHAPPEIAIDNQDVQKAPVQCDPHVGRDQEGLVLCVRTCE